MLFRCNWNGREKWVVAVDSVMFGNVDGAFADFVNVFAMMIVIIKWVIK